MHGFPLYTVCIGQNFQVDTKYNGAECVIIDCLKFRHCRYPDGRHCDMDSYLVQWECGSVTSAAPDKLRRKFPPVEDKSKLREVEKVE